MTPLLTRGRWGIYSDGRAIWLCDRDLEPGKPWCSGRYCHTPPQIHDGPLRRLRPWYAPWRDAHSCVRWALRQLDAVTEIPRALEDVKQEIADAAEVERILETL